MMVNRMIFPKCAKTSKMTKKRSPPKNSKKCLNSPHLNDDKPYDFTPLQIERD